MSYAKGIDVSAWQGRIDWEAVKASGIEFAMIRAGHGKGNVDKMFQYNISECNRIGLPCGAYWFSYAKNADEAAKEAAFCVETLKPYKVTYPVAFDFEYDSVDKAKAAGVTITPDTACAMVAAFCGRIAAAGYIPINYTNVDYMRRYFTKPLNYATWLAEWPATVDLNVIKPGVTIWQYSSTGRVPGITGNVDLDISYVRYEEASDYDADEMLQKFKSLWDSYRKSLQDNDASAYSAQARDWAVQSGLVQGGGAEEFNGMWEDFLTREQLVTILYRYDKMLKGELQRESSAGESV